MVIPRDTLKDSESQLLIVSVVILVRVIHIRLQIIVFKILAAPLPLACSQLAHQRERLSIIHFQIHLSHAGKVFFI